MLPPSPASRGHHGLLPEGPADRLRGSAAAAPADAATAWGRAHALSLLPEASEARRDRARHSP